MMGVSLKQLTNSINKIMDKIKANNENSIGNIENLNTQTLYLELGAGDVHIENVIATGETKIDGGARKNRTKIL